MPRTFRCQVLYSDAPSVAAWRITAPYLNLESDIEFHFSKSYDDHKKGTRPDGLVDAVLLQRPSDKVALAFIQDMNEFGVTTIIETDDDLENVPFTNPVHKFMNDKNKRAYYYGECLKAAKYLHVSTPELKKGDKSTVFYNAVKLSKYVGRDEIRREFREKHNIPKENKIILWSGSTTHYDSLILIVDIIKELLKDEKITVVLISNLEFLSGIGFEPHDNLIFTPFVSFEESYKLPAIADIVLVPLPKNAFNACKSELKCIEAGAWKVPTICSMVNPYIRFFENSKSGCSIITKEKTKYWIKAVRDLIDNPFLYKVMSDRAYRAVEETYNLEIVNKQRAKWWQKLKVLKYS